MLEKISTSGWIEGVNEAQHLQGPGCDGDASVVDTIAVCPGVVHCPPNENIGRVHRSLLGSLLPLRIVFP